MAPRILYLATADARGHLMRAQLLTHALRAAGAEVRLLTTSDTGQRFLAAFGVDADILSRHYAVQFDARQNMLRRDTDRNVAGYMFRPTRMGRDMVRLARRMRHADLVINDSFHPALLTLGALPGWRNRMVHVYGASLYEALVNNFDERLPPAMARVFRRTVAWLVHRAYGRIEHDFACTPSPLEASAACRLPTPVPVVATDLQCAAAPAPRAAVYLNPHFRDPALADALEAGLAGAGLELHGVGEGYVQRPGWQAQDTGWVEAAARSALIVSSPGMAALSVALVYGKPILLICTDQPEQHANAQRAKALNLWQGSIVLGTCADDLARQIAQAARALLAQKPQASGPAPMPAQLRLGAWVDTLMRLADARMKKKGRY